MSKRVHFQIISVKVPYVESGITDMAVSINNSVYALFQCRDFAESVISAQNIICDGVL